MAQLRITARPTTSKLAYGQTLHLEIGIHNLGSTPAHLVTDRINAAMAGPQDLHVFVGQGSLPDLVCYYGFLLPKLRRLGPQQRVTLPATVGLPLHQGFIDVNGIYAERELPLSGSVRITAFVGYVDAPVRPLTDDPWGEFVAAQKIRRAAPIKITVAAPGP